jgi:threonylcarbamoyladenosine tRNA methylthiotransferase MtaB
MSSVAVRNFGCRANQAEAFAWADALRERGLSLEEDWAASDVVLVHSCTLTGRADRDVRKLIRAIGRESPATGIVVTGCYAERAPDELAALPNVVAVLPRSAGSRVAETVAGIAAKRKERRSPGIGAGRIAPAAAVAISERPFRARAYLKVQDGCDNRCAFCVIPGLRGPSASVPPGDVAASVRALASRGFREIVLAGIHLGSYGRDLMPKISLVDLLREIRTAAAPARLRLSSLDPNLVDEALVAQIAGDPGICPHVHLSLQHASTRVLRGMGRAGDPGSYRRTLGELRRLAPEAALGADIIVGFPGETDGDFEELRAFLDASPLTYVHVFPFSPRPGTPAWGRPRVPDAVVTSRAKTLRRLSAEKNFRFRSRFAGRTLEAVVIGGSDGGVEVLTSNGIKVEVPQSPAPRGELVRVRIGGVLPRRTEGEVVS